ncbi:DNA cytosine methyltransferase [uncultured Senegalimassilia sp.]|uniref:DNA cytosine methyltransferase n=1 Tax=uncultured Senegalimassilia sp. TaxID=1714350 RepID=UPI0027DDC7C1|nr:DNA cytosine methyltransferase [uncultured Senegalimassilia sp.]
MKPTVIDLFAGVGGLSLGFEMAGFEVALANEYDPSIAEAYKKNRPNTKMIVEDITKLPIEETFGPYQGKVTVVIGGPPCQGFSQKGMRKSINDPRNFLFRYYFEVVKKVKPEYFVIENVPNLLTTENGYFKDEIVELFSGIGYAVSCGVLCAADFGVPQDRRRTCIMGKLGAGKPVELPEPNGVHTTIWDAISDLSYFESGEGAEEQSYRNAPQSEYQKLLRAGSSELYNHIATRHSKVTLERLKMIAPECGKEMLPEEHHTKSIYSGTWCRMKKDGIAKTITTRYDTPSSGEFTHPYLDRAITTREAARIQSFPDTFRFYGSKSSQMKQVGNAVPPLLGKAIAERILDDMKNE